MLADVCRMHLHDLAKRGAGVETYERDPVTPVADGNGGRFILALVARAQMDSAELNNWSNCSSVPGSNCERAILSQRPPDLWRMVQKNF
jgi:hypothetical protein